MTATRWHPARPDHGESVTGVSTAARRGPVSSSERGPGDRRLPPLIPEAPATGLRMRRHPGLRKRRPANRGVWWSGGVGWRQVTGGLESRASRRRPGTGSAAPVQRTRSGTHAGLSRRSRTACGHCLRGRRGTAARPRVPRPRARPACGRVARRPPTARWLPKPGHGVAEVHSSSLRGYPAGELRSSPQGVWSEPFYPQFVGPATAGCRSPFHRCSGRTHRRSGRCWVRPLRR